MRSALCCLVAAACLAACVNVDVPAEFPCSIGGACPPGQVCDVFDRVCRIPGGECGDGVRNVGERCDDGNRTAGDGCHPECAGIEQCGDALVDPGEACDDGNPTEGDGCDSNCSATACGNGVASTGEACDDGNLASGDGCRADCLKIELCSDGLIDTALGEVCDDGNVSGADGCRADCKGTEVCGDSLIDVDEPCDGGATCTAVCAFTTCGDGTVNPGEICLPPLHELVISDDPVGAYEVIVGDIDGDNDQDVLWLDFNVWRVRRNTGNGVFTAQTTFPTTIARVPRLFDLDRDGDLDIVGLTQGPKFAYHLNNGSGGFAGIEVLDSIEINNDSINYEIGDVDGDGDNDLLVASNTAVLVLRNDGILTFTSEPISGLPGNEHVLALGDVDGDNRPDLLTGEANTGTTEGAIRLNNGNGTFGPPVFVNLSDVSGFNRLASLVDLDGDDDLDILTQIEDHVGVVINTGGTFGPEKEFQIGVARSLFPGALAVGDLDGDDDLDVVLATGLDLAVFRNNGAGELGAPENYASVGPRNVALGDLDGDGDLDVATTSGSLSGTVVFSDGASFAAARTFDILRGERHEAVVPGDFNGDGELDLVFANSDTFDLSVVLGDGTGRFPTSTEVALPGGLVPIAIAAGNIDGDQALDVVAIALENGATGKAIVFTNNGSTTLSSASPINLGLTTSLEMFFPRPAGAALGDLDEDGDLDLVASIPGADRIAVLLGNGDGTFGAPTTFEIDPGASILTVRVAIGDLDADGHLDVAISNDHPSNTAVLTMRGDGTGALQPFDRQLLALDSNGIGIITGLAFSDVDGDGDLDVFAACIGKLPGVVADATITVFVNDGTGKTPTRTEFDAGGEDPSAISIGDIDNDGDVDVAVGIGRLHHMSVVRNDDGKILPPMRVASGLGPAAPTLADFNHDGAVDLVWAAGSRLHVLVARP